MKRTDPRIFALQADLCKALANPVRLEILHRLGDREVSFGDLQRALGISKPNLSQHLGVLRNSRVVVDRREGQRAFYRLAYPEIAAACQALQQMLARHLRDVGKQAQVLLRRVG